MSGTYAVTLGDRGRLVLPAELRARLSLEAGDPLVLVESEDGVVLATRAQAARLLRAQLQGPSLVERLVADRRAASATEDLEPDA